MYKKIKWFVLFVYLSLPSVLLAESNSQNVMNDELKLSFSNVYLPHPQQVVQQLQTPCHQLSTKANHIGDYCAVWQLLTETVIQDIVNTQYQINVNYSAIHQQLQLTFQSQEDQTDRQIFLDIYFNQVSPVSVISTLNNIQSPALTEILEKLKDAQLTQLQAQLQLNTELPFNQLAHYLPLYRQAQDRLNQPGYPLTIQSNIFYSNQNQKLSVTMNSLSPEQAGLSLVFEGLVERPVTLKSLETTAAQWRAFMVDDQLKLEKTALPILPTYFSAEFIHDGLFYDWVDLMINRDTFSLSLFTLPLALKQQQRLKASQSDIARNFHGGLAAFLEHPISFRVAMTPTGRSSAQLWQAYASMITVLQQEQALIQQSFDLQATESMHQKKDIQRHLNELYFQQQATQQQALVLLAQYFNMDIFVNGQPFEYVE